MPDSPQETLKVEAIDRILRAVCLATWGEDVDSPMADAEIRFNTEDVNAA